MPAKQYIEGLLAEQCHSHYLLDVKRPGIYQVTIPVYHEDGDAVEIYVEEINGGKTIRISDYGMSLMRLSYEYEIDTPNKASILASIVAENRLQESDGALYLDVAPEELYPGILQLAGAVAKVSSMKYFRKEVVQSLFYETVDTFILEKLSNLRPEKSVCPIQDRPELEVDFIINTPIRPLFIYPVRGGEKAKRVMINCLFFQKEKIPFTSVIVHENMDMLTKRDRGLLTNIVDKQFSSFEAFSDNIRGYVERESMTTPH